MDKESIIELQKIDTNCNDCKHMVRNPERMKTWDHLHIGQEKASHRINYGDCQLLGFPVSFLPNTCMPDNKQCFKHRKDK